MRDVLEYSEEELRSMSTDELESLLKESEGKESLFNTRQLVEKVLINSLYGALGNRWFPLFNEHMAAAITGNGRYFIQKLSRYIESKLQSLIPSEKPYILYGDTDSAYFHVEPFVKKYMEANPGLSLNEYVDWVDSFEKKVIQPVIQQTIEDFAEELNAYNKDAVGAEREIIADCVTPDTCIKFKIDGQITHKSISSIAKTYGINIRTKNNEIVDISDKNIQVLSVNENGVKELKTVNNIQKKVTTKNILKLTSPNGKSIKVTEDHKIAVMENGTITYKEAKDITEDDDVQLFENTFYTKENQKLYGLEYSAIDKELFEEYL